MDEYESKIFPQLKEAFDRHEKETKEKPDATSLAKEASELQKILKYLDETGGGKNAALHYLIPRMNGKKFEWLSKIEN